MTIEQEFQFKGTVTKQGEVIFIIRAETAALAIKRAMDGDYDEYLGDEGLETVDWDINPVPV